MEGKIGTVVDAALWRDIRRLALDEGCTAAALVDRALRNFLASRTRAKASGSASPRIATRRGRLAKGRP